MLIQYAVYAHVSDAIYDMTEKCTVDCHRRSCLFTFSNHNEFLMFYEEAIAPKRTVQFRYEQ